MLGARLLPGEGAPRAPPPSVDEASSLKSPGSRSVHSIRRQFEQPGANRRAIPSSRSAAALPASPRTPAETFSPKPKPAPTPAPKPASSSSSTQHELARFLSKSTAAAANAHRMPGKSVRAPASAAGGAGGGAPSSVSSLIEQFSSSGAPNTAPQLRSPLAERDVQRPDAPPQAMPPLEEPDMEPDTFCEPSGGEFAARVAAARTHPVTDPGHFDGYRNKHTSPKHMLHSAAAAPVSGDQQLHDVIARGKREAAGTATTGSAGPGATAGTVFPSTTRGNWGMAESASGGGQPAENIPASQSQYYDARSSPSAPAPQQKQQQPREQYHRRQQYREPQKSQQKQQPWKQPRQQQQPQQQQHPQRQQHPQQQQQPQQQRLQQPSQQRHQQHRQPERKPPQEQPGEQHPQQLEVSAVEEPSVDSDWGAAHVHLQELFTEAETTAEKAVQCDENEEYYDAFSLYCNVVELYYKVIPFLNAEEGEDVNQRIKMYTRRCEAIREAFESDDLAAEDEIHVDLAIDDPPQEEFVADENQEERTARELLELDEFEGIPHQQATDRDVEVLHPSNYPPVPVHKQNQQPLQTTPGFFAQNSASVAAAHRNRLSRPISRRSVRENAGTPSVSREKVAEMQERVQVMQSCLNNFTVKRKHLGPARALELQITTLNANTFGDLKRLEPLPRQLEHMWGTELEVLLSMLQEIKEARPGTGNVLREDIATHLPALQRCDRIVRNTLRSFSDLVGHVDYVERETANDSGGGGSGAAQRRWWIKVPVVKNGGLPGRVRALIEEVEREMRGVFKVCHEINVEVVKSMPVPETFVEGLPKHARNLISKELKEGLTTWGMFKVSDFMKDRGMWNREAAKDVTSSLEKVALIWEAKTTQKSFISRTFDIRGERFHQAITAFRRCQNAIRDLRRDWPTMTHTDLDAAKIQGNEDLGLAGLEAYSRALESRAARLLTRIRELLDADDDARGAPRSGSGGGSSLAVGHGNGGNGVSGQRIRGGASGGASGGGSGGGGSLGGSSGNVVHHPSNGGGPPSGSRARKPPTQASHRRR